MTTQTACLNLLEEFWAGKLTAKELEAKCRDMESKQLSIPMQVTNVTCQKGGMEHA